MNTLVFDPRPMNQLQSTEAVATDDWLWHGYLARRNLTLLTSVWKSGKTTLLAGLFRALETGHAFLGRRCTPASSVVVSEEATQHWAERTRAIPLGPRVRLVSRPFIGRPTPAQWDELVGRAEALLAARELDVFAVDPLATFLPGHSESDPGTLLDLLEPLRRLAAGGAAVLILHHPRKRPAEEGSTARGSGALLGFVDIVVELHRHGPLSTDANRRRLVAWSRRPETPHSLVYEWQPGTPNFREVADPVLARFQENWATVRAVLEAREHAATHKELLADWPTDRPPPSASQLYEWLARATAEGLVQRTGSGTSKNPFRFRLPRADDLPDLPPLPRFW
jgi:hypothetical protein